MTAIADLLQQMRAAAEKATPGPWRWEPDAENGGGEIVSDVAPVAWPVLQHADPGPMGHGYFAQLSIFDFDAAHIATSHPAAVLVVLDALAKAQRDLATARAALSRAPDLIRGRKAWLFGAGSIAKEEAARFCAPTKWAEFEALVDEALKEDA